MDINIKATRIELTDDMQEYAETKVSTCEKFIADGAKVTCDVELAKSREQNTGPVFYAEVNLEVDGTLYRATAEEESIEAAIDKVKDELTREMRRNKEKSADLAKRGGAQVKEWMQEE